MCTHACAREVCYPGLSKRATDIEEGYSLVDVGPGSSSGWPCWCRDSRLQGTRDSVQKR